MDKQNRLPVMIAIAVMLFAAIFVALSGCGMVALPGVEPARVESVERTGVLVEGAPALTVSVPNGEVRVAVGEAGRVGAVVTRRGYGPDEAAAQAAHDSLAVAFSQRGDEVRLEATLAEQLRQAQSHEAILEVSVPPGTGLTIELANGIVEVAPAGADVTVELANGQVTVLPGAADAFSLDARVNNGTIESGYAEIVGGAGQQLRATGIVGAEPGYAVTVAINNGQVFVRPAR
ncbi:MAG TPA: hypothetical protein PKD53_13405 [Chloroflexaceae bacterium]|nr:hypothetical protein [Chloroflexaceae bacterium]